MSEPQWDTLDFDELDTAQLYQLLKLRQDVFILEQECFYLDLDDKDQASRHMLCRRDGELLAYQRCLPPGASYAESSIGRIVVSPAGRGMQLGRELVQRGIDHNQQRWPGHPIRIGAQAHLEGFYASLGFETMGEPYMEDGILHVEMVLPAAAGD